MNEELRKIAVEAMGGECEVFDKMWFNIFCQKFAYLLMNDFEQSCLEDSNIEVVE